MASQETRPPEQTPPVDEEQRQDEVRGGEGHNGGTIAQELKDTIRAAAIDVLGPATRQATSSAAKYAVSKGPELVAKNVMPAVLKAGAPGGIARQAISRGGEALSGGGGIGGIAGKLLAKLGRRGGGGQATGWGQKRRMPVQQVIYCSVPVRQAYNGWTEYKQWPRYMHRANQVDAQIDEKEARVKVTEKMWGFKRPFTAEVVTQRPDEQIKWNATEGSKHTGVINFHELGPRLTLIEVNLDHSPSGPIEKIARGARFVKRAVRADIHRFQGWIEMKSVEELEEMEGWRGTIEGGQIVTSHEDALEREQAEEDGRRDEEPEGEYEEEPEGEYEEEPEGEYEEEEEPEGEYEEEEGPEGEYEEPEGEYEEEPEASEPEPVRHTRRSRTREHARRPPTRSRQGGGR